MFQELHEDMVFLKGPSSKIPQWNEMFAQVDDDMVLLKGPTFQLPQQNCISVRCIRPARWPYLPACHAHRGGLVPGDAYLVLWEGGACLDPGGCLHGTRVLPAWSRGVPACSLGVGCYTSMHWGIPPQQNSSHMLLKILLDQKFLKSVMKMIVSATTYCKFWK